MCECLLDFACLFKFPPQPFFVRQSLTLNSLHLLISWVSCFLDLPTNFRSASYLFSTAFRASSKNNKFENMQIYSEGRKCLLSWTTYSFCFYCFASCFAGLDTLSNAEICKKGTSITSLSEVCPSMVKGWTVWELMPTKSHAKGWRSCNKTSRDAIFWANSSQILWEPSYHKHDPCNSAILRLHQPKSAHIKRENAKIENRSFGRTQHMGEIREANGHSKRGKE